MLEYYFSFHLCKIIAIYARISSNSLFYWRRNWITKWSNIGDLLKPGPRLCLLTLWLCVPFWSPDYFHKQSSWSVRKEVWFEGYWKCFSLSVYSVNDRNLCPLSPAPETSLEGPSELFTQLARACLHLDLLLALELTPRTTLPGSLCRNHSLSR